MIKSLNCSLNQLALKHNSFSNASYFFSFFNCSEMSHSVLKAKQMGNVTVVAAALWLYINDLTDLRIIFPVNISVWLLCASCIFVD